MCLHATTIQYYRQSNRRFCTIGWMPESSPLHVLAVLLVLLVLDGRIIMSLIRLLGG